MLLRLWAAVIVADLGSTGHLCAGNGALRDSDDDDDK
jgi:hypothetical protein